MPIKAVIFDLDNTLYDYDTRHEAGYRNLRDFSCRLYGLTAAQFDDLYRRSMDLIRQRAVEQSAIHNRAIRLQVLQEQLGVLNHTEVLEMCDAYWEPFLRNIEPFPDVIRFLKLLKSFGVRTGIGTDMTAGMQHRKLALLCMDGLIDFVVTSEEAGAEKPAERFFALCREKAGVPADECIFMGDNLRKDIQGAYAAGMLPVYLKRSEAVYIPNSEPDREKYPELSYIEVSSFKELIEMAGRLF